MKLPFSFDLKFLFRMILPGSVLAVGMYPLVTSLLAIFGVLQNEEYILTLSAVFGGWLILVADMHVYMIFEGRRYWPQWLFAFGVAREQGRVARLRRFIARRIEDPRRYREASVEIRRFPMDAGEYDAQFPTRLGNLLASFEEYSERIYGMDAAFYWPRLWLLLDKDLRSELDGQQAMTDSSLYTAAALYCDAGLFLLYGLASHLSPGVLRHLPPDPVRSSIIAAVLAVISGYALYRVSLHQQAQYGSMFRSVFDVFAKQLSLDEIVSRVADLTQDPHLSSEPAAARRAAWRYLHNYRVKIRGRGASITPLAAKELLDSYE